MTRKPWYPVVLCLLVGIALAAVFYPTAQAQSQTSPTSIEEAIVASTADNRATQPGVVFSTIVPGAPSNLRVTLNGTQLTLQWNAPASGDPATDYIIDVSSASQSSQPAPAVQSFRTFSPQTSQVINNPPPGTYFVTVRALNSSGASGPSNEISGTIPGPGGCTLPGAPVLQPATVNGTSVRFDWSAVGGAVGYLVQGGPTSGSTVAFCG